MFSSGESAGTERRRGLDLLSESACGGKIVVGGDVNKGFVYVLRCSDQKLYTGSTRDLYKRLEAHRTGKVRTTKNRRPVQLIYKEEFGNYQEARDREIYLKSGTGREWLKTQLEGWPSG